MITNSVPRANKAPTPTYVTHAIAPIHCPHSPSTSFTINKTNFKDSVLAPHFRLSAHCFIVCVSTIRRVHISRFAFIHPMEIFNIQEHRVLCALDFIFNICQDAWSFTGKHDIVYSLSALKMPISSYVFISKPRSWENRCCGVACLAGLKTIKTPNSISSSLAAIVRSTIITDGIKMTIQNQRFAMLARVELQRLIMIHEYLCRFRRMWGVSVEIVVIRYGYR